MSNHINVGHLNLNCFTAMSDVHRQLVANFLHEQHGIVECHIVTGEQAMLAQGLEWILQGLGAEGYDFT